LDWKKTLFYLDPPYMSHTRSSTGEYGELEMTYDDHEALLELLLSIEGKFALSGYRNRLYDKFAKAAGWRVVEFPTPNSASSKKSKQTKIECVWMNYG
jgi:DNA adenine methylase